MTLDSIISVFQSNSLPEKSIQMKAYMKGQFEFFGIPSPIRKDISKPFLLESKTRNKEEIKHLISQLWQEEQRELQYLAMEIMDKNKKRFEPSDLEFGESLVQTKSWWDTVDFLSTHFFGPILISMSKEERKEYSYYLSGHENMWMNRVGIIFQLLRKDQTETELLEIAILPHMESKWFFHQKAIGWALRQYSKYNPTWVSSFLANYTLMPLSVREASKYL